MTKWVLGDQPTFTAADLVRAWEMGRDDAAGHLTSVDKNYSYKGWRFTANALVAEAAEIRALTPPADLAAKVSA